MATNVSSMTLQAPLKTMDLYLGTAVHLHCYVFQEQDLGQEPGKEFAKFTKKKKKTLVSYSPDLIQRGQEL